MATIAKQLAGLFKEAAYRAYPVLAQETIPFELVQSTQEKFGHYQWNTALKLAKTLGLAPRQIAEQVASSIVENDLIEKVEIAGPGFINITLNSRFLAKRLDEALKDPHLGIEKPDNKQRVIIDFSSPNTAKEMHVGHLRSTILGDCLARVFEYLGHDVLRLNHIGDWGTAFGMLIAHMKKTAPKVIEGQQKTDLSHLVNWYKESKKLFDEDPDFKKTAQQEVVALQGGDPAALKAWGIICEISRKAYQEIYDLLDIRIQERGESFYNPLLPDIIADLESKGLIDISDGAKCVYVEGFLNREGQPLPLMVQKSDGGYNYDTTDMAAIRQRIEEEKGTHLIYVTDAGQATHFAMVFKAAEKAGYLDPKTVKVDHVPFGLVLGPDGKKFRTRSGETEKLIDLLTTAIDKAGTILNERSPDILPDEKKELAYALGIGAVKYADLSCHRTSDYTFSYERMLRFEGNTAAFIMYSYVRIAGIKRKVKADIESLKKTGHIELQHPSEVALSLHLLRFEEALDQTAKDLLPNKLTDYLYTLAEKFNGFFRDCRVEGSEEETARLLLCEAAARTLRQGMELLGLHPVEKM
jgi:arginyl-tRNA synthetase